MSDTEPESPEKDDQDRLIIKLEKDDSALIVHSNGGIELVSTELNHPDNDSDYLGDIEDLNKTFSLVLALAASLENEELYNRIFHNLNQILMKKWDNLDSKTKDNIKNIRDKKKGKRNPFYEETGDPENFIRMHRAQFQDQQMRPPQDGPRRNKKRKASLNYLQNVQWSPYDKTLTAHFKDFRADNPPEEEE
tara:strand:- start:304 stop:879 length:576 start_codon:yes stop_codon:yes gene_type:complete